MQPHDRIHLVSIVAVGSFGVPAHGCGVVPWNTLSQVIKECKAPLPLCIALIGSFGVPVHGCGVVLWNPCSMRISNSTPA